MTPTERLERAGRLLHGPWWHTALAADLDVAHKTIQRWVNGEQPVPEGVWPKLRQLLLQRATDARQYARTLPR